MFIDMNGLRRYKINLHTHTTASDGHKTPDDALSVYASQAYDMLALTDHWVWNDGKDCEVQTDTGYTKKIKVLSGCEYHVSGGDSREGVFHILALCCTRKPHLEQSLLNDTARTPIEKARTVIAEIHEAGGLAVLAHPAWSLNSYEQLTAVAPFDATEIYNSVSDWGMSDRPYSGLAVDELAANGIYVPLLATDDTHYYDGDECRGWIMAEADAVDTLGVAETVRQNRFYATNGPEIHLTRIAEDTVRVTCSPAVKIAFLSHMVWTAGRIVRGTDVTEATYTFKNGERYVRAEVTDRDGKRAYSPIIVR